MKRTIVAATILGLGAVNASAEIVAPDAVVFEDGAIATSLTGVAGDPTSGAKAMNKGAGNCIACHDVTALSDLPFHGEIGPTLDGAADRWTEAELRGIVTNAKMMFDGSMMPSFYKTSGFIRPGNAYTGKAGTEPLEPLLSAQQIEDIVSFLMTLKEE